jgi:hypothetical protein
VGDIIAFPGHKRAEINTDPGDENVRWGVTCGCGSMRFSVFACGEIACSDCDEIPHNPSRGDVRAFWTAETTLSARLPYPTAEASSPSSG